MDYNRVTAERLRVLMRQRDRRIEKLEAQLAAERARKPKPAIKTVVKSLPSREPAIAFDLQVARQEIAELRQRGEELYATYQALKKEHATLLLLARKDRDLSDLMKQIATLRKQLDAAHTELATVQATPPPEQPRPVPRRRRVQDAVDRLLAPAWQRDQLAPGGMIR